MDHPLASLIIEHQVTLKLVDGLVAYARQLENPDGAPIERADLALFARFFREFADEVHHEKEENVLMPLLSWHGFDWAEGTLADVRWEHEQERYFTNVLAQAGERDGEWTLEDRRSIAATALALADFQRRHIEKENNELFPEVTRRLGKEDLETLKYQLEHFDAVPRHRACAEELRALASRLIQRYAPRVARSSGSGVHELFWRSAPPTAAASAKP